MQIVSYKTARSCDLMAKGSPMVNTDGYRNVVFSIQVPQYFHVKVIKINDR